MGYGTRSELGYLGESSSLALEEGRHVMIGVKFYAVYCLPIGPGGGAGCRPGES